MSDTPVQFNFKQIRDQIAKQSNNDNVTMQASPNTVAANIEPIKKKPVSTGNSDVSKAGKVTVSQRINLFETEKNVKPPDIPARRIVEPLKNKQQTVISAPATDSVNRPVPAPRKVNGNKIPESPDASPPTKEENVKSKPDMTVAVKTTNFGGKVEVEDELQMRCNSSGNNSDIPAIKLNNLVELRNNKQVFAPATPPKPPRLISEVCRERPITMSIVDSSKGDYAYLINSVSASPVKTNDPAKLTAELVPPAKPTSPKRPPKCPQNQENTIKDKWDGKFIRVPHPRNCRNNHMVKKNQINNPNYIYVRAEEFDDIIGGHRLVARRSSDDSLNAMSNPVSIFGRIGQNIRTGKENLNSKSKFYESPNMEFDSNGYAVPTVANERACSQIGGNNRVTQNNERRHMPEENNIYVRSRVSIAYAVLRNDPSDIPHENGAAVSLVMDEDVEIQEQRKRLQHVTDVKMRTYKSMCKYEKLKSGSSKMKLYQYAMIVALDCSEKKCFKPKILFCFPGELADSEVLASNFCFPDSDVWNPQMNYAGETFSFILTTETGDRRYGWCKRYLPTGSDPKFPEAICIISSIGESHLYKELLKAVYKCREKSMDWAEQLLSLAYARPFPSPQNEVYIRTTGPDFKKETLILSRHSESRKHNVKFGFLLSRLSIPVLVKVFAAILLERKIIFCAEQLSTLSLCMSSILSLLFPFEWQHTYVTALPSMLTDIVDAPTPYILGILSSMMSYLNDHELFEVMIVDLDSGKLRKRVGDESHIIPKKIQRALISALMDDDSVLQISWPIKEEEKGGNRGVTDATVSEAFLRMFVETCGHYTEYICVQQNMETVFQRELFVKAVSSTSIGMFLEWFTQTQMFEIFVRDRLMDSSLFGLFEQRVLEYREEMSETSNKQGNVKVVYKKIVDFFKESGDKIKKTFQKTRAVYI